MTKNVQHLGHSFVRFITGNYTLLLTFLFLLFIFRPYDRVGHFVLIWKIFLILTILMAIFDAKHPKPIKILVSILALPSILFTWISLYNNTEPILVCITLATSLFLGICAASILRDVVLKARVTVETLRGAMCVYFLIAFLFSYIYLLIETIDPGTMLIRDQVISVRPNIDYYISEMLYFSFATLINLGYGDIVAAKDVGQTAAVIEGILGKFYIAILVARLVSVYSFYSDKRLLQSFQASLKAKQE